MKTLLAALVLCPMLLLGCADADAPLEDIERVSVDLGDASVELAQRFVHDELVETTVTVREHGHERSLTVAGELLDGEGATDEGARLRRFLTSTSPSLLARLHEADVRWDIAVLNADAMLSLDEDGQREAGRALSSEGTLCVQLGTCAAPDFAGQT